MSEKHRPSSEIAADLFAAQQRAAALTTAIGELKNNLKQAEQEYRELVGTWGRVGTVELLENELRRAKRHEEDATKPRIRVERGYGDPKLYVLSRVTEKRIYLRSPGSEGEIIFSREGTASFGYRIHPDDLALCVKGAK